MCLIFYLLCIFFTYLISKAALGASGTGSTSSFAAFGGKADYAISDFAYIRFCTLFLLSKNKAQDPGALVLARSEETPRCQSKSFTF
jgi:hypothetical protein